MDNENLNDLHDIQPSISFGELESIDLEQFFGASETQIENYISSLANRASIGQLRQVLSMSFDDEDMGREALVATFVATKMNVVRKVLASISELEQE